ncbi:ATP-binding cassette subfamily B protein [Arcanobacterium wilhelmae]|uniref:ATP-binding cassette subfamily B protein n=1 Tax=Arcanobacterium wilhelmae TaxID=1803177 RepID=A0ABT9N9K6_9ACTO|nr:ABC transporter ATP-binding protein [Arcanobacterium wilhelmae]MDP9800208.1 ATP-binding cassette subfamily B protein [Arcanobacterium wilhelmae]
MRGGRGAAAPDAKARDAVGALKRLARMLGNEKLRIIALSILVLLSVIGQVAAPVMLGRGTDIVVDGMKAGSVDFGALGYTLSLVAALYAFSAMTNFVGGALIRVTIQNMGKRLRAAAQEKIDRLSLKWIDGQQRGDLLSRVTNDIDNITQTLMQTFNNLLSSIFTLIGILAIMFSLSWSLSLAALAVYPLGMVATIVIIKRAKPQFTKQWHTMGDVSAIVEESFTGADVVTSFNLQEQFEEVFAESNEKLFQASFRGQALSQLTQPVMGFVSNLSFVVVAVYGGFQVLTGQVTIGGIQALIQYTRQLNQPVAQVASMANLLQSGAASGERIFDFLDTPEMEADADTTYADVVSEESRKGEIAFRDVHFGYEPGKPVIRGLNLEVHPGQQVAIVGPTGAGKTTMVNLLMRFYEIESGEITIDGVSTREFSKDSLRERIGMVLQDTWLFEGTIEENIAYGREGATHADVVAAARATGVDRLVAQLPDGYDTRIDDEGNNISAGEKQLITIARAYISDPSVLILDEATSSVDTRTEMLVQKAMNELRVGRTSFVIAHRLSTIRDADMIIVMVDGDVVEMGDHEALLEARGAYYDLYQSQFSGPADSE